MTGDFESTFMSGRLARFLSILLVAMRTDAQENCSTVTVNVTGGNLTGDYEQGDGGAYTGVDTTTYILQAVSFAEDARVRRGLSEVDGREGSMLPWSGRWRQLVNDCETQMWILADSDAIEEDGFPYYGAFDCADHPADIDSDWIYVDCDDCAELSEVKIVCASEGDDPFFILPVIVGIAVAVLVLIFCIGVFATKRRKKKASAGSHTFADDSEHSASKRNEMIAQSALPPDNASLSHKEGDVKSNVVSGETNGSSTVPVPARQSEHDSSFKKTQQIGGGSIYSASSHQPSRAESLERIRLHPRRDSMAEAAAAAHATLSQAMVQQQQSAGLQSVLRTSEVNRQPYDGAGVKWSAGQNLEPQVEYYNGEISSDSAAGSMFGVHPPPDDSVQEHAYDYDDSVAASSPGAYSEYSHFTAGGRTYVGGMSEWTSDVEDYAPREQLPVMDPPQYSRGKPPAYVLPSVAPESTVLDTMTSGQVFYTPSEVTVRSYHGSSKGAQQVETRTEEVGEVSR